MRIHNIGAALAAVALLALPLAAWAADEPKSAGIAQQAKGSDPAPGPAPTPVIVQDYEPNPAIWRLADEDTTIYLFGTIHILPEGFAWRTAQFDAIAAGADELVVESSDADLEGEEFQAAIYDLLFPSDNRMPTSQALSPEAADKWRKLAEISELPFEFIDSIPPMLVMLMVGVDFSYDTGSMSEAGVETVLEAEFAQAGKPIISIEDPVPVLRDLLGIDEQLMIAQLETDLAEWDGQSIDSLLFEEDFASAPDGDLFALEHSWARGEVGAENLFSDTPFEMAMQDALITKRNRAWAEWLDTRLDQPGVVLVAVGAGHFEGSDSVQNMLAERGLTPTRIN
ncbi:TraB/GumN family protein [Citromicrobium bathyomarinum]|uniref:TraB/GumN family protein n=1 Tax=Citromicrobium bathyomarinum TaxID=72174 RepID=UPI00315A7F37